MKLPTYLHTQIHLNKFREKPIKCTDIFPKLKSLASKLLFDKLVKSNQDCIVDLANMGNSQNSKGVKSGIIGSEDLAKKGTPKVTDPRWTKAGKVSNLYVYPVKSLCGISVQEAKVEKHGLSFKDFVDRQLMIIDGKGNFVTGRQYPKLSLVQVILKSGGLVLQADGMSDFHVNLPENGGNVIKTSVSCISKAELKTLRISMNNFSCVLGLEERVPRN